MRNIQDIVKDLLTETKNVLLGIIDVEKPQVVEAVNSYIQNAEQRMVSLLENLAQNGDVKFLLERLAEEKDILFSEVLSFVVIGKSVAQEAINAIQDILLQAIGKSLAKE